MIFRMIVIEAQHSLHTLQKFVRRVFIINFNSRDVDAMKVLDNLTKNIAVPSRSGKNIASKLRL